MGLFDKFKKEHSLNKEKMESRQNMFPFDEAPDTVTLTCSHIINGEAHILFVSHDREDGMWQFLCGRSHEAADAKLVSLQELFNLDKSVGRLVDMPCGYYAERETITDDWVIRRQGYGE